MKPVTLKAWSSAKLSFWNLYQIFKLVFSSIVFFLQSHWSTLCSPLPLPSASMLQSSSPTSRMVLWMLAKTLQVKMSFTRLLGLEKHKYIFHSLHQFTLKALEFKCVLFWCWRSLQELKMKSWSRNQYRSTSATCGSCFNKLEFLFVFSLQSRFWLSYGRLLSALSTQA